MKPYALIHKKLWTGPFLVLLLFCCTHLAVAQEQNSWQNELTIYGWYSGINGDVHFPGSPGSGADFTVDASDIISDLNMIFMGGWQSKKGKWSFIADVVYMDVGDSENQAVTPGSSGVPVNASLDLDISTWLVNAGVGYDVVQTERSSLAVVGGVRYMTLDVDVKAGLQGPGVEQSDSESLLDGIIGVSGSYNFNENWYLPYHADIGTGGSDLTWQLFAAIGYRFSWGDIRLGYRYLSYDLGDDAVMQDMDLNGPVLGVGFTF